MKIRELLGAWRQIIYLKGRRQENNMYDLVMSNGGLRAPREFWLLTPGKKKEICNGAGPKDYGWLVPDTIWILNITACADIHDFMYSIGTSIEDKRIADRVFLNNMIRLIQTYTKAVWLKKIRLKRAKKYYMAVDLCAGAPFWHGKDKRIDQLA